MPETEPEVVQSAALIVLGENLEPSEVSQALGLSPSQAWRKGEQKSFTRPDGQQRFFDSITESGGWKLWQDEARLNDELGDQLAHWASVLRPKAAELLEFRKQGAVIKLDCCVISSSGALVEVNHALLGEIGNLGVDLSITFYAHEDGNEVA